MATFFRGKFCQIPQHSLWNSAPLLSPYTARPVLTENTSKYREFIVTYNTKTHNIRPRMMKTNVIILIIIIIKVNLQLLLFYKWLKLKRSPKQTELDLNLAKTGNSAFPAARSKFHGKRWILRRGVKICMPRNTAGADNVRLLWGRFPSAASCSLGWQSCGYDSIWHRHKLRLLTLPVRRCITAWTAPRPRAITLCITNKLFLVSK